MGVLSSFVNRATVIAQQCIDRITSHIIMISISLYLFTWNVIDKVGLDVLLFNDN